MTTKDAFLAVQSTSTPHTIRLDADYLEYPGQLPHVERVVELAGRGKHLGPHPSPESRRRRGQSLAEEVKRWPPRLRREPAFHLVVMGGERRMCHHLSRSHHRIHHHNPKIQRMLHVVWLG